MNPADRPRFPADFSRALAEAFERAPVPGPAGELRRTVEVIRNFSIRSVEERYEVFDIEGQVLGTADTFMQARAIVPNGAHEELPSVHAIRLSPADRRRIIEAGFPVWG